MKQLSTSSEFFRDLLHFQPTLANAICALDQADRSLEEGREDLVRRKTTLPPDRFLSEITRLGRYQQAIDEAIRVGKTLGDYFAWFFYQNELGRLYKHFEHDPITEIPTGIGQTGELTFINNFSVVDGHFVLYHGITTILRHGDLSFVDLGTFKLTCLGELKSREMASGELAVTAHFIGPKDQPLPDFFRNAPVLSSPRDAFPPKMAERFKRQLRGMAESFKPIPAREELSLVQDTHYPLLMKIAEELERSEAAYEQCGDGLLLAGFRTDEGKTLFDKLLDTKFDPVRKMQNLGPHVQRLMDMTQGNAPDNTNSLIISALGRDSLPGATPLCWWPIPVSFLEKLFFQDATVVTIYNPAHLIRRLREQGFQVHLLGNRRYDIHKMVGERKMSLEGFDSFLRLIQNHLVSEDIVLSLLSHAQSIVETGRVGTSARIPFYFVPQFQHHS